MTPNLFVAAQRACQPHTWFKPKAQPVPLAKLEVWEEPVPGLYKHVPVAGWSLIAIQDPKTQTFQSLDTPLKVAYCKVLHRWFFHDEMERRTRDGFFMSRPSQKTPLKFFCLDDGRTWVQCFTKDGDFIPGPYQRFVLDAETLKFRPMLRCDDPKWEERRTSDSSGHSTSVVSSLYSPSNANTPGNSRRASLDLSQHRDSLHIPTDRPRSARRTSVDLPMPSANLGLAPSSGSSSRQSSRTRMRSRSPLPTPIEERVVEEAGTN